MSPLVGELFTAKRAGGVVDFRQKCLLLVLFLIFIILLVVIILLHIVLISPMKIPFIKDMSTSGFELMTS